MENKQNANTETCPTTQNIPIHEKTKLFIGGLSTKTTLDSFEAYFEKFGKVKDAFVTRGFGFVTFFDEEIARAILAHTEHFIDGKAVDAKPALNRHLNPMREKLFVGGIPTDLTTEELIVVFSKWGTVSDAHVMKDGNCGKNRGYGFVCFVSREATQKVLNERCIIVRNRIVEIKPAEFQSKREQHAPEHSLQSAVPLYFPHQYPADAHHFYSHEPKQTAKKRRFPQQREQTRHVEHAERAVYSRQANRVQCEYYPRQVEHAEYPKNCEHAEYPNYAQYPEYANYPLPSEYPNYAQHPEYQHPEYPNYTQHQEQPNYAHHPEHSPRSMHSHSHHFPYPQPAHHHHHHNYAHYPAPPTHIHSVEPLYYAPNLACFTPIISSGPDSEAQTTDCEEGEISQLLPEQQPPLQWPHRTSKRAKVHN